MDTLLWVTISGGTGFLIGALWREAYEIAFGKEPVLLNADTLGRLRTGLILLAFIVPTLLSAVVGIALMSKDQARRTDNERLVQCQARYNQMDGEARALRVAAVDVADDALVAYVRSDRDYQRGLLRTLRGADTDRPALIEVVERRARKSDALLEQLVEQQSIRDRVNYPDPEFCEKLMR